jgi:hypothetical protein
MPQLLISADRHGDAGTVVYKERVSLSDLESDHFSHQLVERVGWALHDADELEHEPKTDEELPPGDD